MKKALIIIFLSILLMACRDDDESDKMCTANCTTMQGRIFTMDQLPVKDIKLELNYHTYVTLSASTTLIKKASTDNNGNYQMIFSAKSPNQNSYYTLSGDISMINQFYAVPHDSGELNGQPLSIPKKGIGNTFYDPVEPNATYTANFYLPKKATIQVTLKNFQAQENDNFEVQSIFPFGFEKDTLNPIFDLPYESGFSGYGRYRASSASHTFNVMVAENEKNVISVFRRKNGVNTYENIPVFVPKHNSITLSFDY